MTVLHNTLLRDAITDNYVDPDRLVALFHTTKRDLAGTVGLPRYSLYKRDRVRSKGTQRRLREVLEILNRVQPWVGSPLAAYAWYRSQALPGFADHTAEQLVNDGQADAVRAYLDSIADGEFA